MLWLNESDLLLYDRVMFLNRDNSFIISCILSNWIDETSVASLLERITFSPNSVLWLLFLASMIKDSKKFSKTTSAAYPALSVFVKGIKAK